MKETIWKFQGAFGDEVSITMPEGAQTLYAVASALTRTLTVWAVVKPTASEETRLFHIRGTGHPLGEVGRHVATTLDDPFVWHIFEAAW